MSILLRKNGFTLIELSIVLVIIGLLAGGIVVGQDLIKAAQVRSTITQVEKYQTATAAFREEYGYLPGDIPAAPAAQFGFAPRGNLNGEGDGNGILQGINPGSGIADGSIQAAGENPMFWVDLSTAGLIDGSFSTASATANPSSNVTGSALNNWLPSAKLGQGNYIYAYSYNSVSAYTYGRYGTNYFGLSAVTLIPAGGALTSTPALTVQQAYSIDKKVDDGLPTTGRVQTLYIASASAGLANANGVGYQIPSSSTTCSDNGNVGGATLQYSVEISNGSNVNCALSFQFQAGD